MNDASEISDAPSILKKELSGGQLVIAGLLVLLSLGAALIWEVTSSTTSYHNPQAFSLGESAYEDGRYDDALHWYQSAAQQGDIKAQYALAMMYLDKNLTYHDAQQAKSWLVRAAQQDFSKAQYQLGVMLEKEGSPANIYEHWLETAAKQGMGQATLYLIRLYDTRNTPKDSKKALDWLDQAKHQHLNHLTDLKRSVLAHIKQQAKNGETQAMYMLGNIYWQGSITGKNTTKAFPWMLKAAQHHHIRASEAIARMLLYGEGVRMDRKKAFHWYQVTRKAGSDQAKEALACMMVLGSGTRQNISLGIKILKELAEAGNASAARNLGIIEAQGIQGEANDDAAFQWFKRANEWGDKHAKNHLGVMYALGRGVAVDMAQARRYFEKVQDFDKYAQFNLAIIEARGLTDYARDDKAVYWLQRAEAKGNYRASFVLGLLYAEGQGVHKNIPKAIQYYQRAIEYGSTDATYNLAMLEYQGDHGLPLNINHAIILLTSLAEHGDAGSQNMLANIEFNGLGVDVNIQDALHWYQQAAKQGYAIAQFNLGNIYRSGIGTAQNDRVAAQLYQQAAQQAYAPAQNTLAYMYVHGRGVTKNLTKAKQLLEQASRHLLQAKNNLEHLSKQSSQFTLLTSTIDKSLRGNLLETAPIDLSQWFQMKRQPFP